MLAAVSAVLVAAITQAAGRNRIIALAAGATVWVWPYVVIWQSVREGGFRFATLCCGLTAVLCCVLAFQRRAGALAWLVLGLALGLGWWASPEIVYFALPCLVLLVGWWRGTCTSDEGGAVLPARWRALLLAALGAALGSLPWWYANAHTGFSSLQQSALPANGGVTYGTKLSVFFHYMLPMQLGVRAVLSGAWLGGPLIGQALYVLVLVLVVGAVVRAGLGLPPRRRPARAGCAGDRGHGLRVPVRGGPGHGLLERRALRDLPARSRGGPVRLGPGAGGLVAGGAGTAAGTCGTSPTRRGLAVAGGPEPRCSRGSARFRWLWRRSAGAWALPFAAAHAAGIPASPAFFSGWRSGDTSMQQAVDAMRHHHIDDAYGDDWTVYDLDFLSGGRPLVSPESLARRQPLGEHRRRGGLVARPRLAVLRAR